MALLFIGVTALICLVNFIAKDKESSVYRSDCAYLPR